MQWLKELSKDDILKYLDKDALLIADSCGIDVLLSLWNAGLQGTLLYLNSKPIRLLRGAYISKQYQNHISIKMIAKSLNLSEQSVYRCLREYNRRYKNQK